MMSRRAPAAIVLVLGFALRLFRLGEANLWWDEAFAVWAVRKSFIGTTLWTAADVHPPLFFWLQWTWLRLAGQTEFAVRFVPAATGVLAAALAYALGRRLAGPRAGLIALLFVSLARFEVWWSMELRMYMLAGTAILAATYAAARWLGAQAETSDSVQDRPTSWLVGYVLAATCALYTIYMAGVAVASLALSGLVVLWYQSRTDLASRSSTTRAAIVRWIVAQAAVLILVLPWLALALPRMQSWSSLRDAPASMSFVLQLWATLLATGVSTELETARVWTVVFWCCALVIPLVMLLAHQLRGLGPRGSGRRADASAAQGHCAAPAPPPAPAHEPHRSASLASRAARAFGAPCALEWILLGPFLVLPALAVWAATQPRSLFYSPSVEARYLLPFAGPVYVLAAATLSRAWPWSQSQSRSRSRSRSRSQSRSRSRSRSRVAGVALGAAAIAALVFYLPDHYDPRRLRDEMQSMTLAIWSQAEPGDAVVLLSGNRYPMFLYYYDQPWDVNHAREPYLWPEDSPPKWSDRPAVIPFPNRSTDLIRDLDWQARIEKVLSQHDRVWLAEIESHLQDPNGDVETWLNDRLPRVLSEGYGPNALHLYDADGDEPRVTGVSSNWPWTRDLEPSACKFPCVYRGPFESDPVLQSTHHRVVGAPARYALPGDTPGFTLFELEAPDTSVWMGYGGREDTRATLWSLPETAQPDASPWAQRWPDTGDDAPGSRRFLMQIPVGPRFPSGQGRVHVHSTGGLVAPMAVRDTAPILHDALRDFISVNADFGFVSISSVAVKPAMELGDRSNVVYPGDEMLVDIYWRLPVEISNITTPVGPIPDPPPTVFVHLIGPPRADTGDPVWASHDGPPSSGPWLTQSGGWAYDRHVLALDAVAPPGMYELVTGLYDPVTMERYSVTGDDADPQQRHVRLGTVFVK